MLRPYVEKRGLTIGKDFYLVYSPEREDPGNPNFNTQNIPKIVGGTTAACRTSAEALYGAAVDEVVPVSSTQAAEMTKLLENIHRAVNIGLVNEMKIDRRPHGHRHLRGDRRGRDQAVRLHRLLSGPRLGGHCIPIDPFYLTWKAREYGSTRISSSWPARSTATCRTGSSTRSRLRSTTAASH